MPEFLSENREIVRAMRTIRTVIPEPDVCLLTDSVLDDQKMFVRAVSGLKMPIQVPGT